MSSRLDLRKPHKKNSSSDSNQSGSSDDERFQKRPQHAKKQEDSKIQKMIPVFFDNQDFIEEVEKEAKRLKLEMNFTKKLKQLEVYGKRDDIEDFSQFVRGFSKANNIFENKLQPIFCSKKFTLSRDIQEFENDIMERIIESSLDCKIKENNILVKGPEIHINGISEYIEGIKTAKSTLKHKIKKEENEPPIEKLLELHDSIRPDMEEIEKKSKDLKLILEEVNGKISVIGPQKSVLEFVCWIYTFTLNTLEAETLNLQELEMINGYVQSEINITTFHRVHKKEILEKADELDLTREFGYDVLVVSGQSNNIKELKSYLHEVETSAKRALYPEYWDFYNVNPFSEIEVQKENPEFQKVSTLFYNTMNGFVITKLSRIQNKYLMDMYITTIHKRQELRPENGLQRKLLFHGTRNIDPKTIYMNSDTGFDIQYANPHGSLGKGLYFAINANYSDGYRFNLPNNRFQMFLADVFIGKPYQGANATFVKAPEGFDSTEYPNTFYVVYNNFHSYPLYLIEYQVKQ